MVYTSRSLVQKLTEIRSVIFYLPCYSNAYTPKTHKKSGYMDSANLPIITGKFNSQYARAHHVQWHDCQTFSPI